MSRECPTTIAKLRADQIGYEVGYGRPPQHTQFRPGQSGNPAGRRKGVRNLADRRASAP